MGENISEEFGKINRSFEPHFGIRIPVQSCLFADALPLDPQHQSETAQADIESGALKDVREFFRGSCAHPIPPPNPRMARDTL